MSDTKYPKFERQLRYFVIKWSDLIDAGISDNELNTLHMIFEKVDNARLHRGKQPLECVVVESDWPEYEPTWQAIEARVTGNQITQKCEWKHSMRYDDKRFTACKGSIDSDYIDEFKFCPYCGGKIVEVK